MLWPTPSPEKLSKAAVAVGVLPDSPSTTLTTTASTDLVGLDSFDVDFENTDVSSSFIPNNSFDNSRPSSPAIPHLQNQSLQPALAVDLDNLPPKDQESSQQGKSSVLRTPPESPIKGHGRSPAHPPTYPATAQEQEQQQQQQQPQPELPYQTNTLTQPHQLFDSNTNVSSSLSSPPSSPTLAQPSTTLPPKLSQSLSAHPLFKDCTEAGIQLLASRMHIRHYHPQDHIIHRSEQSSAMFYILRGTVKVVSHDNEATYYEIKENNFFGDVGVLYRVPRTMDVLAKNRCTIAILPGDDLVKAMEQSPEMAKAIGYQTQERYQMYLKRRQSVSARRTLDGGTGGPDEYQNDSKSESFAKCDVHSAIRKVPLFQSCPSEVIHMLSLNVEPRTYNLGQSIIHRGEIGREMFFIASGTVEILSDDNLRVLARFRDGQFFGEIAVLLDVPRIANVKAVSEVEVFVLTKDNLEAVFKAVPGAAEIITSEGNRLYQDWLNSRRRSQSMDLDDTAVIDPQSAEVKSTLNEVATPPCTDHIPLLRRRSSEATVHPIEAGHPAAISVLPLTCATDFKRGHRASLSQSSAMPVPGTETQDDSLQEAPPISFFNQDAGADEAQEPPTSRNPTIRGLQGSNPRRRRASVAVWSQQDLMKLAEAAQAKSSIDTSHAPVQSTSLAQSVQPEQWEHTVQDPTAHFLTKDSRRGSLSSLAMNPPKKLMGPATFQDLHDNIVAQVLNALPIESLLAARRVCSSWNTLIMENENVLTDLDLSMHKKTVNDAVIASICSSVLSRKLYRTTSVSLRDCFLISDKGLAMMVAHIPGVRNLDLHSCWNVTDAGFRTLGVHCPELRSVDFSNCRKLGDETIFGLYPKEAMELVIPPKEQLVEAVLGPQADSHPILEDTIVIDGSTDTSMDQTQVLLTRQPSIDMEADGQGAQIAPSDSSPLVADTVMTGEPESLAAKPTVKLAPTQIGPRGCPLLSHLNLSYCKNLTDKSFIHLSLYGSKQLVSLNLQRCTTISPEAFISLDMDAKKAVGEAASATVNGNYGPLDGGYNPLAQPCFPRLRELCLSDCTFLNDAAIIALAPNMPAVEGLSLSFCCALTDLAIEALLDSCAFLRKLDLSFCGSAVSDASLYQMAQMDAQEPGEFSLEDLEIRGCVRVTEHGIREIIDRCPNLKRLNVSGCSGIGGALSGTGSPMDETLKEAADQPIGAAAGTVDVSAQSANGAVPAADMVDVSGAVTTDTPTEYDTWGNMGHSCVQATNNGSSGSLAAPAHGANLARKMDALKRGKEWVLAQQRPGLTIIA
ncbi:hypothetical protein EMPS_05207 [Entomortierella parvispora]|uniref:Cyclic nucleotide-binding domain-containing protein n=1 Tax=Entomortierella parvispora TaxID=205924 RepID=A0A9P3LWA6_9FUNG|nr:hypothetical protein EMPS_05207 [Entomortierella parvispora]